MTPLVLFVVAVVAFFLGMSAGSAFNRSTGHAFQAAAQRATARALQAEAELQQLNDELARADYAAYAAGRPPVAVNVHVTGAPQHYWPDRQAWPGAHVVDAQVVPELPRGGS